MDYKKNVSFLDKEWNRIEVDIRIENSNISFSWNCWSSSWQIYDSIIPKNDSQLELIHMWKKYHLNDMRSCTEQQELLIDKWKEVWNKYDYEATISYLSTCDINGNELTYNQYYKFKQELEKFNSIKWLTKFILDSINNKDYDYLFNIDMSIDRPFNNYIEEYLEKFFEYFPTDYFNLQKIEVDWNSRIIVIRKYYFNVQYFLNILWDFKDKKFWDKIILDFISDDIFISALIVKINNNELWFHHYWHWWLTYKLPDNIINKLDIVLNDIEIKEQELKGKDLNAMDIKEVELLFNWITWYHSDLFNKVMATCDYMHIDSNSIQQLIIDDDTHFSIEWSDYLVCTNGEANDAHLEYVKNLFDDIWFEWFNFNDKVKIEMDLDWCITISKEINIKNSERWNSLNSWDGKEYVSSYGWQEFYLYKQ